MIGLTAMAFLGVIFSIYVNPRGANKELGKQEVIKIYNQALPQTFVNETDEYGQLVVDTTPEGARVQIDPPDEEAEEQPLIIPINTSPFKMERIPAGEHVVSIYREGYELYVEKFNIERNKQTVLDIKLIPATIDVNLGYSRENWIKMLPILMNEYYIEYDPQREVIKATLNTRVVNQFNNIDQRSEYLKELVREKLKVYGVDINKENIEWIIN